MREISSFKAPRISHLSFEMEISENYVPETPSSVINTDDEMLSDGDIEKPDIVNVISTRQKHIMKFRMTGTETTFKFNTPPQNSNEIEWLKQGFGEIVEQMKNDSNTGDQLGFTLKSSSFKHRDPGYIAFRPAEEIDIDVLWNIFGGIVQSNAESVKSSDTFIVECTRINLPVGTGRVRPGKYNTFE